MRGLLLDGRRMRIAFGVVAGIAIQGSGATLFAQHHEHEHEHEHHESAPRERESSSFRASGGPSGFAPSSGGLMRDGQFRHANEEFRQVFVQRPNGGTFERSTRETGPRGRTIERDVRIERSPGMVERDITITRPGGTFSRDTVIQNVPGAGWVGGGTSVASRPGGRTIIENNEVIINNPAPQPYWGGDWGWGLGGAGFGFGLPGFNMVLGAAQPYPPVIVAPAPPPPILVGPLPPPVVRFAPTVPFDPVLDAMGRLKSLHENSRRDGALTLGNLKADRAVPALLDRLKNDWSKEVRVASAWALGEIGDPRSGVALQRASLFDHRSEVRAVAAKASDKIRSGQNLRASRSTRVLPPKPDPNIDGPAADSDPVASTPRARRTPPAAASHSSLLDLDPPPPNPTPYVPDGNSSGGSSKN